MKKAKTILAGAFITSTIVLGACNSETEVDNPAPEDTVTEEDTMGDDSDDSMMDDDDDMETDTTTDDDAMGEDADEMFEEDEPATTAFGFSTFELGVSYEGMTDDYTVDYDHTQEEVHAEIDDSMNDTQLEGDEAYTQLETKFEEMQLDSSMSEDEIVDAVVSAFGLESTYETLDLKITFDDGTDLEIEHSQDM
ncbi:YusW family protein [Bacillus sp. FJAT-45037]|uniref:YusW family protein n=1 Tax=Bacillus sp. FJAT-45037 TaxID=2011007 RepID=UPI000C24106B|nr:YusW family protein [Bacillus sp. FJAT-45037]